MLSSDRSFINAVFDDIQAERSKLTSFIRIVANMQQFPEGPDVDDVCHVLDLLNRGFEAFLEDLRPKVLAECTPVAPVPVLERAAAPA